MEDIVVARIYHNIYPFCYGGKIYNNITKNGSMFDMSSLSLRKESSHGKLADTRQ
jgi:hypothetical protein